ncbi:rab-3A-interacting protein isoform X6 [Pygocentrus nattereri]|uniref:rab-3A-interacting protein isoform X6 n=1 Tax=Pygocentrus nattereri TaxID=42514 RepID=UPI001890F885|nr:rab-3A-interacting protein isoform X6 [Pygocentrus nattereri]
MCFLDVGLIKEQRHWPLNVCDILASCRSAYYDSEAMANEPLEGFHEVNLASPTTPDLHGIADPRPPKPSVPPSTLYRTHSLTSAPGPPNTLYADQLPTQPVYPAPRHLGNDEPQNGSVPGLEPAAPGSASQEVGSVVGVVLGDEGEDPLGLSTDSLSRLRSPSVMEVREKGYERLKEELAKAQRELKLKDEECERLSKVRDQLGQELEELTASLFEEAHKMVREANVKQATAEKQLKEALGKVDSLLFNEFKAWKEEPTLERTCSFLDRIYREDIYPCLTFSKSELGSAILEAVERNTLSVEPVGFQPLPVVKASAVECGGPNGRRSEIVTKCALSGQTKTCKHRIKFGDSSNYYYVSPFCRYRITSVCNFFTYIRYIHQGLVKQQDAEQMFWEVMQLRKEMSYAKLGYYRDEL